MNKSSIDKCRQTCKKMCFNWSHRNLINKWKLCYYKISVYILLNVIYIHKSAKLWVFSYIIIAVPAGSVESSEYCLFYFRLKSTLQNHIDCQNAPVVTACTWSSTAAWYSNNYWTHIRSYPFKWYWKSPKLMEEPKFVLLLTNTA